MRALRRVAEDREPEAAEPTDKDAEIGEYLLSEASVAVRDARARKLLTEGVESGDLHALEALLEELERAPDKVWAEATRRSAASAYSAGSSAASAARRLFGRSPPAA